MSNSKSHKCHNYFAKLLMAFVCLVLVLSYLSIYGEKTETPSIHDLDIDSVTIIPDDLVPYQSNHLKSSPFARAKVDNLMHKHRSLNSDRGSSGRQTASNVDHTRSQFKTRNSDYDCFCMSNHLRKITKNKKKIVYKKWIDK